MRSVFSMAMLVGLALAAPAPDAPPQKLTQPADRLVDMVVAEVGASVVTLSELVAETRLVLLKSRGPDLAWTADLTPPLLAAVLRSIVHRELLLQEVKRLQLRDPDPEDIERAVDRLRSLFVTNGDFDRFLERSGFIDVGTARRNTPAALAAIIKAEILAERFLDVRVRLNVSASAEEIAACYKKNAKVLGGRSLEEVRTRIAGVVRSEKERAALVVLIEQLEKRTPIVYLPPFERAAQDEGTDDLDLVCRT